MMARCEGNEIEVLDRVFLPHSLGSFYTMICEFIGYKKYGDEGKVMGLAPYGKDTHCEAVREIIALQEWRLRTGSELFHAPGQQSGHADFRRRHRVSGAAFLRSHGEAVWRSPPNRTAEITQRDMDLAYAMQHRFEEVFFHLLNELHKRVPLADLAMAGGCALNSVANGKLFTETPFRRTWIQPAAGDEGLAIGAALHTYHSVLKQPRRYEMKNSYLGPEVRRCLYRGEFAESQSEVSQAGA